MILRNIEIEYHKALLDLGFDPEIDGVDCLKQSTEIIASRIQTWSTMWTHRHDLVKKYSWALPSLEALRTIAAEGPIVEMGAGGGYWAYLLRQLGVDIIAFDRSPGASYWSSHLWTKVEEGGPPILAKYPERSLLLIWPPLDDEMEGDCLGFYEGDCVLYVGEVDGCTGDGSIFEQDKWSLDKTVEIPKFGGLHDNLHVFRRYSTIWESLEDEA